jgi:hypothetical protein
LQPTAAALSSRWKSRAAAERQVSGRLAIAITDHQGGSDSTLWVIEIAALSARVPS